MCWPKRCAQLVVQLVVPPVLAVVCIAKLVAEIAVAHQGEGQPKPHIRVVVSGEIPRRGRRVLLGTVVIAIRNLIGHCRLHRRDRRLDGHRAPGVVVVPKLVERLFPLNHIGGIEADSLAVEDLRDFGVEIALTVAAGQSPRHELAPFLQFAENAVAPRLVEGLLVILLAVSIGVQLHGPVVDIVSQPVLGHHEIVKEAPIVHQLALNHLLIRIPCLVFRDLRPGQVEPISAGPDLDLLAGRIPQEILVRDIVVFYRVDRSQDQAVGIQPPQLADLIGGEVRSQPQVDAGGIHHPLGDKMPRSPEIGNARKAGLGGRQTTIRQVQHGLRSCGTADVDVVDDGGVRIETTNDGLWRG